MFVMIKFNNKVPKILNLNFLDFLVTVIVHPAKSEL